MTFLGSVTAQPFYVWHLIHDDLKTLKYMQWLLKWVQRQGEDIQRILYGRTLDKYRVFTRNIKSCCLSLHMRVVFSKEILQNTLEEKSVNSKIFLAVE